MPRAVTGESGLLEPIFAKYEAEGFDVFVHPSPSILPEFMRGHRPDAIAVRGDRKIAIEVARARQEPAPELRHLQELISEADDWELAVVYLSPRAAAGAIEIATPSSIDQAVRQVEEIAAAGQVATGLVIGWSVLEAVARSLLPEQLARAQPPAQLVEVLAGEGLLTPSEADALRPMAMLRNVAAHGQLDVSLDRDVLAQLIFVIRTLADMVPKRRRK